MPEKTEKDAPNGPQGQGKQCCSVCNDLLDECGPDLFPLYSKKLLIRGWAGRVSPVEERYVRAHRSEAAEKAGQRRAAHLRKVRFQPQKVNTQDGFAS